MQVFTGSLSGRFVSNGTPHLIELPQGIDSVVVRNETVEVAAGAGTGCRWYWNSATPQGQGVMDVKTVATNALAPAIIPPTLGFYWVSNNDSTPLAPVALTGINGALPPLVTTGSTAGLIANTSIVRIYNTVGALQLRGVDFTIGAINPGGSFTLAHMAAIVNAAPGAGNYAIVPYNPMFYPSTRVITKMWNSTTLGVCPVGHTVLTLSVNHNYVVGQKVTLRIPAVTPTAFGTATQLNNRVGTIVAIGDNDGTSTNTIRINIESAGMTFAWPLTADPNFTPAMVIPHGMDTAVCKALGVSQYLPRTFNDGVKGLLLMGGATGPAGINGDVISWTAFKSYNT